MSIGPVDLVVFEFPGNQFTGEIVPALEDLIKSETVRIIDLLFVTKAADGTVGVMEVDGLGDALVAVLAPMVTPDDELLSHADGEHFGSLLEPNSSAALLLFENTWAARFVEAMDRAKGRLLLNERIPRGVIQEVLAETTEP